MKNRHFSPLAVAALLIVFAAPAIAHEGGGMALSLSASEI